MRAFQKLSDVVKGMENDAITTGAYSEADIKHLLDCIDGAFKYNKYNYVFHLERHSKVKSHCISFLLSDPKNRDLQNECSDDDCHTESCSFCDMVPEICQTLMAMVRTIGKKQKTQKATLARWEYEIDQAEKSIHLWRNFIMRNKVN